MNEYFIIKNYLKSLTNNNPSSLNLSDDIYYNFKNKLALSLDTYVEGVHFVDSSNPKKFLKKVLRSSLSDLYCKGIKPSSYFLSLALNSKHTKKKWLSDLKKILNNEQKRFSISLSGGDTVYSSKLVITIAVIGYSKKKPIFRNSCRLNDDIYVTGSIGDSFLGLNVIKKKKNFGRLNSYFINKYYEPNLQNNFYLYLNKIASSSIDISDGLNIDLKNLISKTKYGAVVNLNDIPLSLHSSILVKKKLIKVENIFSRGDDYQILFTSNKKNRLYINNLSKRLKVKLTRIGIITKGKRVVFKLNKKIFVISKEKMGYMHNFK